MPDSSSPPKPVDPHRWFHLSADGEHGPMDFRELRYRGLQGKITAETEIWTTNDATRRPASEVNGLLPEAEPSEEGDKREEISSREKPPFAETRRRTVMDGPPGGLYLPYLKPAYFSILVILMAVSGGLAYAGFKAEIHGAGVPLFYCAGLALVIMVLLSLVYLHRAWSMLRILGAPISGEQAITMMVFPVLNAIMSFRTIFGWSRFWNYQVRNHPGLSTTRGVWRPVFFLFCLGFLISQGLLIYRGILVYQGMAKEWAYDLGNIEHQMTLGVYGVTLLLGLTVWAQFCRAISFLAQKKS